MSDFQTGYYGKLPVRGDFIQRNLPLEFIQVWDPWLQRVIASSRETLNTQWLDHYLICPVWHYFFTIETGKAFLGIMLPSVDKVGRYFPFTITQTISNYRSMNQMIENNSNWFQQAENIALQALNDELSFEELNFSIDNLSQLTNDDPFNSFANSSSAFRIELNRNMPLDIALSRIQARNCQPNKDSNYSYWWTQENENSAGNLISCQGFPDDNIFVAMLDGHWELCHINTILDDTGTNITTLNDF